MNSQPLRSALAFLLASVASPCVSQEPDAVGDERPRLDLRAPIGTVNNPVRATKPIGQRDYLMRLRCPEGDAPTFSRAGSMGTGPYGSVIDHYKVKCANGLVTDVVIDMYHRHRETTLAAPGFTLLQEHPAKLAPGCPPEITGHRVGTYVFHMLEVETPARIADFKRDFNGMGMDGNAEVSFVVGSDGRVSPDSIKFPYPPVPIRLGTVISDYLVSLRFEPALHKAKCPVPQRVETRFWAKSQ